MFKMSYSRSQEAMIVVDIKQFSV